MLRQSSLRGLRTQYDKKRMGSETFPKQATTSSEKSSTSVLWSNSSRSTLHGSLRDSLPSTTDTDFSRVHDTLWFNVHLKICMRSSYMKTVKSVENQTGKESVNLGLNRWRLGRSYNSKVKLFTKNRILSDWNSNVLHKK